MEALCKQKCFDYSEMECDCTVTFAFKWKQDKALHVQHIMARSTNSVPTSMHCSSV